MLWVKDVKNEAAQRRTRERESGVISQYEISIALSIKIKVIHSSLTLSPFFVFQYETTVEKML